MIIAGGGSNDKQTLIEEDTTFKGALESKRPIVVNGRVEGELKGPALYVSAAGAIEGSVSVAELESYGELQGQIEADSLRIAGVILDGSVLKGQSIEVRTAKEGEPPVIFGSCQISVGDAPPTVDEALSRRKQWLSGNGEGGEAKAAPSKQDREAPSTAAQQSPRDETRVNQEPSPPRETAAVAPNAEAAPSTDNMPTDLDESAKRKASDTAESKSESAKSVEGGKSPRKGKSKRKTKKS